MEIIDEIQLYLLRMEGIIANTSRISFLEGFLILIGILWVAGYLKKIVYVPVVIKEKKPEDEKEVVAKGDDHMIYREKKNPDESYTDFEEIKS